MSACVPAFILTLFALCGSAGASVALGGPTNVRMNSYNMDLVLRWDPPEGPNSSMVVYTTRLGHKEGCVNTSSLQCDFTRLKVFYSEFGNYTGRVRVLRGGQRSDWVESNPVALDQDTIIGPPNVTLFASGASIEVSIKDPAFSVSTLRDVYGSVTYNVTYWEDSQRDKARRISNTQQDRLVLSDLEVWTRYCFQVQIKTRNPKPSVPSRTVCETTGDRERAPWVAAVVAFLVLAAAASLVTVAVVNRKRITHFLCPKDTLPQHLKQYLLEPPDTSRSLITWNPQPADVIYHQVSVTTDSSPVEEGRPLEAAESNCSQQPDVTVKERDGEEKE
ncbi:interleukin-10 receptor subunit beta-like [Antennarius striatus]|uniref:interleukin-10 receptor subunit beta-like n=1 Tax=Antennarius striatus TaxID=241820 RepID=UPI0035B30A5B